MVARVITGGIGSFLLFVAYGIHKSSWSELQQSLANCQSFSFSNTIDGIACNSHAFDHYHSSQWQMWVMTILGICLVFLAMAFPRQKLSKTITTNH